MPRLCQAKERLKWLDTLAIVESYLGCIIQEEQQQNERSKKLLPLKNNENIFQNV